MRESGSCAPTAGETVTVSAGSLFLANNRFSPDSGSLAAVAFEGFSSQGVRIVDLCGALVTDIGNDDGPRATIAWSDDAATVFYGTSDGAKSVPAAGGAPEDVVADADTFDVSPDGSTLVYSDNGDLFTWGHRDFHADGPHGGGDLSSLLPGRHPGGLRRGRHAAESLTLAGSAVDIVGAIDNAAFQPFDWLSDDSFAVAASAGVETVVPDGASGYTRTTVEGGSGVQDIDVSPDGTMISYRIKRHATHLPLRRRVVGHRFRRSGSTEGFGRLQVLPCEMVPAPNDRMGALGRHLIPFFAAGMAPAYGH